jgi:hypothetical protein
MFQVVQRLSSMLKALVSIPSILQNLNNREVKV